MLEEEGGVAHTLSGPIAKIKHGKWKHVFVSQNKTCLSPMITNNTRSSNLVTSATEGYKCFNFAFMENSVMAVMVVTVELGNFVQEFILICCE